ncbi:MAG: hypothetical protein ACPGR2_12735 [Psychrobium sp.]
MNNNQDAFLSPFARLTNKWLPNFKLNLTASSTPRREAKDILVTAVFNIDYSHNSRELGGINSYNCSSVAEVKSYSKKAIESSINGQRKSVCDALYKELSNNSLFASVHRNKLPLKVFEHSCLVTCSPCSGRGRVTCGTCYGSGQVDESRYEVVGYDEYRDSRGYVTRQEPRYGYRSYRVTCSGCGGSGQNRCSTCHGDGQNTYIETVDIYAKLGNWKHKWSKFETTTWTNDYLHSDQDDFELQDAGTWQLSKQQVTDHDNGAFTVTIPGEITAADCNATLQGEFATSKGQLKTLGGLIYDCDYIYTEHTYNAATSALAANQISPQKIKCLTSSPLFNVCGESGREGKIVPYNELRTKRMITSKSTKAMHELLMALQQKFQQARSKLSVLNIFANSAATLGVLAAILMAFAWQLGSGVVEHFNLYNLALGMKKIVNSFQLSHQFLNILTVSALIFYIPAIITMKVLGAKKNLSTKRILRWFWITLPIFSLFVIFFTSAAGKAPVGTIGDLLIALPILDLSILALLVGILFARKKSWAKQAQAANEYQSNVLMKKLDYKE